MRAPIVNSIKHMVNRSTVAIATGTLRNDTVVDAVAVAAAGANTQVTQGSVIKAVYVELWFVGSGTTGNISAFTMTIEKLSGGQPLMTFTNSQNLFVYPNKKNVLYTTQAINSTKVDGANPVPMIRGWVKIPKGKQRFGLGDRLLVNTASVGAGEVCGVFIYKEYS